jgi:DNA-binding GntR family transcriptional regulator
MLEAALDRNVEAAKKTLTVHIEKGLEHTLAAF